MDYEIKKPWLHIHIDTHYDNSTIEHILDDYKISRKNRYLLQQNKHILLNNENTNVSKTLHEGNTLSIYAFPASDKKITSVYKSISIVYEDDFLLVVDKEPHLLIHSDGNDEITLSNYVQGYYDATNQTCAVRAIHRLDKDTTGLVMFCKCAFLQPYFDDALKHKQIHREYLAIVEGKLPLHKKINIDQPIGKDRHDAQKQRVSKTGKGAFTTIECLQQFKHSSLVNCTLKTGRTHQIRVHMAHIKHPILSDPLYGHLSKVIHRLALHAYRLTWIHPITHKENIITCEMPDEMKEATKKA